ncbi:hypothetical protein JCM8097_008450 [Rhodosporidiobolus ruineniae]
MLFTRFLPALFFAGAAVAHSSPSSGRFEKRLTVSADVEASISAALETAVTEVKSIACEIKTAVEGVEGGSATEVVQAVESLVGELTTTVKTAVGVAAKATVSITKRGLQTRDFDVNTVAQLVANLLNEVLSAVSPIVSLVDSTPGLGALLHPLLSPLQGELVTLINTLASVVVGLVNVVLTLLDNTVVALLKSLGLGGLLSPLFSFLNL